MKTIGTATRELTNIPLYWEILTIFNFCEASKALIPKQNGGKRKGEKNYRPISHRNTQNINISEYNSLKANALL